MEKNKWSIVSYFCNGDLSYQIMEDSKAKEIYSTDNNYEILLSSLTQSDALNKLNTLTILTKS